MCFIQFKRYKPFEHYWKKKKWRKTLFCFLSFSFLFSILFSAQMSMENRIIESPVLKWFIDRSVVCSLYVDHQSIRCENKADCECEYTRCFPYSDGSIAAMPILCWWIHETSLLRRRVNGARSTGSTGSSSLTEWERRDLFFFFFFFFSFFLFSVVHPSTGEAFLVCGWLVNRPAAKAIQHTFALSVCVCVKTSCSFIHSFKYLIPSFFNDENINFSLKTFSFFKWWKIS